MSLINEALKKAQRQRHETPASGAASSGSQSGGVGKRGEPRSAQTTLLIVAGAVVLVVVSIALTAFWLTRPPATPSTAAATGSVAAAGKGSEPAAPSVTFNTPAPTAQPAPEAAAKPVAEAKSAAGTAAATPNASVRRATGTTVADLKPATPTASSASATNAATAVPAPAASADAAVGTPTAIAPARTEPATPPAVAKAEPPPKPDDRIQQFIDAAKVAGVRPSGSDSKVLMNDRVYRLNDFVDRSLGLRLTKVTRESLTFTDANGVVYVKDL